LNNFSEKNIIEQRAKEIIEQMFFNEFYLLNGNISEEFIEEFDSTINLFWELNRDLFARMDNLSGEEISEIMYNFPDINTVFVFFTGEEHIYGWLGQPVSMDSNFESGFPFSVPASFSNSKLFISQLIHYHGLNSNPEYNPYLLEEWNYGSIKYVRENNSPFLVPSENSISGRDILVTLDENTEIRILRNMPSFFHSQQSRMTRFFEGYSLLHEAIILDGTFEGRRGFIPNYYLN